jgi:hypothetical protein
MAQFVDAGCPECGAPATYEEYGAWESPHGPVRCVKITCAAGHWFLGAAETLLGGARP